MDKQFLNNFDSKSFEEIQIIKDDEIDLVAVAKTIWLGRRIILITTLSFMVIGLIIAFASPIKFSTYAIVLPQTEVEADLGQLGSLAGLAGINLSSMMGDGTGIQPELYPNIVSSYPFLNDLIHAPFTFEEHPVPISIYDKMMEDSIPTVGSIIFKYTLGLPLTIKNAVFGVKSQPQILSTTLTQDLVFLNMKQQKVYNEALERISVVIDKKSGLVTVSGEMEEPLVTAQLVQKALDLLQKYIVDYKTKQVRENLVFIQDQTNEKRLEFEEARKALFEYKDMYRNQVAERTDFRFQELSDNYDISSAVYQNLAQQLEQSRIAVKKETPAFSVIEPVKVPVEKAAPKRVMIIILSAIVGSIMGLLILFGRISLEKLKESW